MIRGAIEMVQDRLVAGWIYARVGSLRDQLVLAFSGPRCVGSGHVEIFRRDLLDADLGDGYCGFHFPIELQSGETLDSIVVKLADSDAVLLQPGARVSA